uniref:MHC class I-like antigen recognition-like domain-containing protein n=1 Tax=Seriola dumerili TaxID=41447 RepID=A0A3B4TXN4_SERDU
YIYILYIFYFYTASSQVPNCPRVVVVGVATTRRAEPKQDWVNKASRSTVLGEETGNLLGSQQTSKLLFTTISVSVSGVHVLQQMYGCEWDDETGEVNGYDQHGYDGEDFLIWDLKTKTWIAPTPQAVITKHKWDNDKAWIAQTEQYLNQICPEWLKKYLDYGRILMLRTGRIT